MDQEAFDELKRSIEGNIREQQARVSPSRPVLSQMQMDARMVGYSADGAALRDARIASTFDNYTCGASLVLRTLADRYKLKYDRLDTKPPR